MYKPFTILFGRQWYTFTLLMMFGTMLSLIWFIYRAPHRQRAATLDIFLAGLFGGVVIGRLVHVALQWQYFVDRTPEIRKIYDEGGLDWHAVFLGALFSMLLMARLRKIDLNPLLDTFAVLLPIWAILGWWACATIGCAYGLPIERMADYPRGLTWVQPDIFGITEPRFATQLIGIVGSIGLFGIALVLHWRDGLRGGQLWLIVLLLSMGMFGIGFLRGDFSRLLYHLRDEQWLDIGLILFAGILHIRSRVRARRQIAPEAKG
ncbi:MAG: prolipoprotein diacylglyceryl transferase [Anaerolineae bacterium]|nr:prolipoprotein diacylglyceryl transferase [Anaerolineae bacterium]